MKKVMQKRLPIGGIAAAILLLCALPLGAQPGEGPSVGSIAPPFLLPDTQGRATSLSDLGKGMIVLNFWAFWCDTWKAEMPSLRSLARDEKTDGFQIAAISVDGTRLPVFEHSPLGQDVPFPVLLDTNRTVSAAYGVHHVPTVVLIDRTGHVRYTAYGYPGNHVLLSQIRRIEAAQSR